MSRYVTVSFGAVKFHMLPAKFAWSDAAVAAAVVVNVGGAERLPLMTSRSAPDDSISLVALRFRGHLDVTLMRFEKNSIPPSPVISMSPNLDRVPYKPPNEKGSRGTGMPAQGRKKHA